MSNRERREARRRRRDLKRAEKRRERQEGRSYERLLDLNHLHKAAHDAAKGVRWKTATQSYETHLMARLVETRRTLAAGEDPTMPLKRFDLMERGKLRHIQAAKFPEKVVQKALTTQIIRPIYTPTFTAGNSANMKGRGTLYAINRLKRQLVRHYRRHGRAGWILLVDYSDYFASIPHDGVIRQAGTFIDDPRTLALIRRLVDREDGSHGLGLGSEPSQVFAVAYPDRIDHWLEQRSGCEATGRYMDDTYVLDPSKQRLQRTLDHIISETGRLGIRINPRKTKIVKLSHGFTWLKKKWDITETGRIVIRPSRKAIARERRKLKKLARHVQSGRLDMATFQRSYASWRGSLDHLDARRSQRAMDRLYRTLADRLEKGTPCQTHQPSPSSSPSSAPAASARSSHGC